MSRLPVPPKVLEQHVIALGKTRSAKSSKLRVLVESLCDRKEAVAVIDPKGDWWGIKSSADGKGPGYPFVIFGGARADVPLNPRAGAAVAELVVESNRPCLIDLKGWMPTDRTKFFIDFAAKMFQASKGERWLVIDEVHNFAPKGRVLSPDVGVMLHWANRLASEGLGLGIRLLAASQRPQKVHNDFLTSCETLIACRVIHKSDRDAIKDWIDGCADPTIGKQVLAELAGMKRPESWVWSPEIDFGPERITWPLFRTYDSFKPQEARARNRPRGWADVDLEEVRLKLAAVVKEADDNDPKKLRAQVAELQRQLAKKAPPAKVIPAGPSRLELREAENVAFANGRQAGAEQERKILVNALSRHAKAMKAQIHKALDVALNQVWLPLEWGKDPGSIPDKSQKNPVNPPLKSVNPPVTPAYVPYKPDISRPIERHIASNGAGDLTKAERLMLTALSQFREGCSRSKLALTSGYSITSSTFDNALSGLRTKGYINRGAPVQATEEGLAAVGDIDPLPTGEALREYWLQKLGKAERTLLGCIIENYPEPIGRDELGNKSGYSPSSSTFDNALSTLRTLELITRGELRANEELFT